VKAPKWYNDWRRDKLRKQYGRESTEIARLTKILKDTEEDLFPERWREISERRMKLAWNRSRTIEQLRRYI